MTVKMSTMATDRERRRGCTLLHHLQQHTTVQVEEACDVRWTRHRFPDHFRLAFARMGRHAGRSTFIT